MTAEEYIERELAEGRLTAAHIAELTRQYQENEGINVDGKPGPLTRRLLDIDARARITSAPLILQSPMPPLADGRKAVITSRFKANNPSRPNHNGVDFFYPWRKGDKPDFVGDKGCAGRLPNGDPKWVVPYGIEAVAVAAGKVQIAGWISTGYRVWIDHGNGWRTGYFHLEKLSVVTGQGVHTGQPLGLIGHNPADNDARHLHFELSPVNRYEPVDPEPYLVK